VRTGRRLELTETGRPVRSGADKIFEIGGEPEEALRSKAGAQLASFRVGITEVEPKSPACQLLSSALCSPVPLRIICREDKLARLLSGLALHRVDLV